MKKFRVQVNRDLSFETIYTVVAETEVEARDKAHQLDCEAHLLSGKWTNTFRKAVSAVEVVKKPRKNAKTKGVR